MVDPVVERLESPEDFRPDSRLIPYSILECNDNIFLTKTLLTDDSARLNGFSQNNRLRFMFFPRAAFYK